MLSALFRSSQDPVASVYDRTWGWWQGDPGPPTASGQDVTPRTALQLLTVYGCATLIADSISTLPVDTYRQTGDGTKVEFTAPDWLTNPTVDLAFPEWCSQILMSLLLQGNAYVWIVRGPGRGISELVPLDPMVVRVVRENGRKVFYVNGQRSDLEIAHIPAAMLPGALVGLSPVDCARQSIGLGLAAQQYGSHFFSGDGNMPGVIESPKPMQPAQMRMLAEHWQRKRNKGGKGLPGVLDDAATWKPTGVSNEAAQFLATRNFTAAEIAGQMFKVDPADLGIAVAGTSLTYANLAERNTRRVQVTFLPWMIRVESFISGLLANPRYMKFNVDALLRGDPQQRAAYYSAMSVINDQAKAYGQPPVMLTAEMRALEDFDPIAETKAEDAATPFQLSEMVAKIFRGVDTLATPDELRGILNRAGAGLTAPFEPPTTPMAPPPKHPTPPEVVDDTAP